ncbi:MAG: hypothetical protein WAW06_00055 [bacterium]
MSVTRSWLALGVAVVAVLVLAVLGISRQAGSEEGVAVGRYQLVSGCYGVGCQAGSVGSPAGSNCACEVFKIDTATGETWVCRGEVLYKGTAIEKTQVRWEQIQ